MTVNKNKKAEAELRWFFNNSEADCGFCSSWQANVNQACYGNHSNEPYHYTDALLKAVNKRRYIERKYFSLPIDIQYALYALYAFFTFPYIAGYSHIDVEALFKRNDKLAALIVSYPDLLALCKRWKCGKCSSADKALIVFIKQETEKYRVSSIIQYMEAK